ncbi:MAG: hypothetical protein AB1815_02465 [Bacillota bacterium]
MRYLIDEVLVVGGEHLDRGFVLDPEAGLVHWTEPILNGETFVFPIQECKYLNGTPVSPEDGELIGEPL